MTPLGSVWWRYAGHPEAVVAVVWARDADNTCKVLYLDGASARDAGRLLFTSQNFVSGHFERLA